MCGFLVTNLPATPLRFAAAMNRMAYRGPDNLTIVPEFGGYSVGHCRLAIIGDSVLANQPMIDASGNYLLVFNGEIYNYREVAEKYGLHLTASSDTELLLRVLILRGVDCLSELNGMYSFVLLDRASHRILAARDPLGTKPLYMWHRGDSLVIASEIASILDLVGGLTPDAFALRQYRALRGTFNGRTFYQGVSTLPPGSWWDGTKTTTFWSVGRRFDTAPTAEELRSLVDRAIGYRMVADVKVGGFLSGGLDSTIVALQSGIEDTWCAGFANDPDFEHARQVAANAALDHREVVVNAREFITTSEEMIRARHEPLAVPNEVMLFLAARDARRSGIKCTLSGEGADELFAGYDRVFAWAASADKFDALAFGRLYCYGAVDMEAVEDALQPYLHFGEPYLIVNAFFQTAHLAGLLRRLDFATMFAGVEGREPFADVNLVERLFGLPFSYKHEGGDNKYPLKVAFRDLVPPRVAMREKRGFPAPLEQIFGVPRGGNAGYTAWFDHNLRVLEWQD